jgi:transposase InsO family protein
VADALSRHDEEQGALMVISAPQFSLFNDLRREQSTDPALVALREQLSAGQLGDHWGSTDDLLTYKGRVYLPASSPSTPAVLEAAHGAGHEGIQKTLNRVRRDFHISNARRVVEDFVRSCVTCQRNKSEQLQPGGLLQPLEVPSQIWADILMDFIEALPRVHGKTVILTVVDRFSKYAHFIPLAHPYTAQTVARAFFDDIVRLHGFPQSIVSDRDSVFTSAFWTELFRLAGVRLCMSTAFHPQSDGQSEVVNKVITMYLRCLTGDRPKQWVRWLPWAEYCYNTSFHTALRDTPFRIVYGRDPPSLRSYEAGDARIPAVEHLLTDRDAFLQDVHDRLLQAQQRDKLYYDNKHREVSFEIGQWVWLRLHHRPATSLTGPTRSKLAPRFYGPYKVLQRIDSVAYRLELPPRSRLHNVFHVSLLKPFHGDPPAAPPTLPDIHHGRVIPKPEHVHKARLCRGVRQILVQLVGQDASQASWEDLEDFKQRYPEWQLADDLLVEGGSDVMWGRVYGRRKKEAVA